MNPKLIQILMAILQALISIFGDKANALEAVQTGGLLGIWRRRWIRGMVAAYAWQHAKDSAEAEELTNQVMAELTKRSKTTLEYIATLLPPS